MPDISGLCLQVAHDSTLTEADVAVIVCWFLGETSNVVPDLEEVVRFMVGQHIRPNINKSRLRANLKKRKDISLDGLDRLRIPLREKSNISKTYGIYIDERPPEIIDNILVLSDFDDERIYVKGLARQINSSYQFHIFDGCAVLMRRLVEVLLIEAYERAGIGSTISDGKNYLMMAGILNEINSGRDFKMSRNAPRILERCKDIGDNAAHSRNYLTKKLDIDELAQDYRRIIEEIRSLVPRKQ